VKLETTVKCISSFKGYLKPISPIEQLVTDCLNAIECLLSIETETDNEILLVFGTNKKANEAKHQKYSKLMRQKYTLALSMGIPAKIIGGQLVILGNPVKLPKFSGARDTFSNVAAKSLKNRIMAQLMVVKKKLVMSDKIT
jgi:hypothetical protein